MSYAIRNDGQGGRSIDGPGDVGPDEYFSETLVEVALNEDQLISQFRAAIQAHLDSAAVKAGYDDIKNAVTYAEEPAVAKFQAEGKALRAWRSLVWAYGYEQIDAVQSGAREMPTTEQLIAELPALVMP